MGSIQQNTASSFLVMIVGRVMVYATNVYLGILAQAIVISETCQVERTFRIVSVWKTNTMKILWKYNCIVYLSQQGQETLTEQLSSSQTIPQY